MRPRHQRRHCRAHGTGPALMGTAECGGAGAASGVSGSGWVLLSGAQGLSIAIRELDDVLMRDVGGRIKQDGRCVDLH